MQKFEVWIKQFQGANSPFGDLAGDIAADKNFPESNNYKILRNYLEHTAAFNTFEIAWKHYKGQVDTKTAHYQLGIRLEFARMILSSIRTPETNEILRGKESSRLDDMTQGLSEIKSIMDDLIFNEKYEWANKDIYYDNSRFLDDIRNKTISELNAITEDKVSNTNSTK